MSNTEEHEGKKILQTLIVIDDDLYDVTKFVNSHPGEGFFGISLVDFNRRNCSEEFERYHRSDEAFEILDRAKKGTHPTVRYVGKSPKLIHNRLPKQWTEIITYSEEGGNDKDGNDTVENKLPET